MTREEQDGSATHDLDIAVVGLACRFPGADDPDEFWEKLRTGADCVTHFGEEELRAAGVPDEALASPSYVRSAGVLRDVERFDAAFFGFSPREAELLEPAHRLFLECAWEALEDAGWTPEGVPGRIGVYGGAGYPAYTERHVLANAALMESIGPLQAGLGGGKDFLATRTAYKLGLRGPAITVQTACSTSLVAVHLAVQGLLSGETDLALAGGATVLVPQVSGYMHAPGSIVSPDGRCRAFDAASAGTLSSSGAGMVALKRLGDALRDGDPIRAIIHGSAVNNDGATRVAFSAPGVEGQAAVISEALAAADVHPDSIGYVEAHGSGTDLGDTIEIAALTRAWRAQTDRIGFATVGSVKTNLGHLDAAAGIAGLIKTVLALEHAELPPTVHFQAPNPKIDFAASPFVVRGEPREWERNGLPRRAAVSSFGIGGTNAHVVLEEAPAPDASGPSRSWQVLTLSARSPTALDEATGRLAAHLATRPELPLADVAHTLQQGRRAFPFRRAVIVAAGEDAAAVLGERTPERSTTGEAGEGTPSVAFLFPGVGDHYPQMARGLYESEPVFRREVDRCLEMLGADGSGLRDALFPGRWTEESGAGDGVDLRGMLRRAQEEDPARDRLGRTALAQPAVFVVSWALTRLWESWGVVPEAVIGHSLGEYTAACVAGIMSLEDALRLVADRARVIDALPGGSMLAVSLNERTLMPFLEGSLAVATVNAPELVVAAGPDAEVADLERRLAAAGHTARRLAATHAFHSPMMADAAGPLRESLSRVRLRAPRIPMVSNLTGTWITDAQATDPEYWTRHLLQTVRFADGMGALLAEPGRMLVEVGPGQTLSTFVRQRAAAAGEHPPAAVVPSLRYPYDRRSDGRFLAEALGRLWTCGADVDWAGYRRGESRRRVRLPTYPWERQRYWIEPPAVAGGRWHTGADGALRSDPAAWTELVSWSRTAAPSVAERRTVLLVAPEGERADGLASAFERAGHLLTLARPGEGYSLGRRMHTVRYEDPASFRALVEGVLASGLVPDVVVHAQALDDPTGSLLSLLHLAAALAWLPEPPRLIVATTGAREVTGIEAVEPRAGVLAGAAAAIAQELPALRCRSVDFDSGALAGRFADRAVAELVSGAEEAVVALRGRHRWAREFRPEPAAAAEAAVLDGGNYLIFGAEEGRAAFMAGAIAGAERVRITLAAPGGPAPELVAAIEARGAEVHAVAADPDDAGALAAAVAAAEARWGPLDGVILSPPAGLLAEVAAVGEADASWLAALDACAAALDAADAALAGRRIGFRVVESSLAATLGYIGRVGAAAAHGLVDAWAAARGWCAVGWDHAAVPGELTPSGAADLVRAVLARTGEPQVLVSPVAIEYRLVAAALEASRNGPDPAGAVHARPELDVEYHPPTSEVEERLATLWAGLLGIERIGVHDDFFGLGGHSLLATQIVARVRDVFGLELPLSSIFEAPTVARYAALVEEAIISELEALPEEEASQLAGA